MHYADIQRQLNKHKLHTTAHYLHTVSLALRAHGCRLPLSSHQIRMPHQSVLATGHLDPGWHRGYKKTLPLPTLTLLPSSISSRKKKFLLQVIDPSTAGENNNNQHPDGGD
jgi:hypothetical protein